MTASTSGLIRAVQTGRRKLGLSDEDYHALLEGVSGKTSSKELTAGQLQEVLRRMRKAGFTLETDPQLRKIRSLWFSMYDEGIVKSSSDQSIAAYIRRITKKPIKSCSVEDLQRVIETMKQWIDRTEDEKTLERLRQLDDEPPLATSVLQ